MPQGFKLVAATPCDQGGHLLLKTHKSNVQKIFSETMKRFMLIKPLVSSPKHFVLKVLRAVGSLNVGCVPSFRHCLLSTIYYVQGFVEFYLKHFLLWLYNEIFHIQLTNALLGCREGLDVIIF